MRDMLLAESDVQYSLVRSLEGNGPMHGQSEVKSVSVPPSAKLKPNKHQSPQLLHHSFFYDNIMKLLLIRHGETVDNVAGLYAGVRNSALTVHGFEQANRLGDYISKTYPKATHIFASPLTRALKTAQAIQKAQNAHVDGDKLGITTVPDLIEQDFGSSEGKPSMLAQTRRRVAGKATMISTRTILASLMSKARKRFANAPTHSWTNT
jgi:hypothetical protein